MEVQRFVSSIVRVLLVVSISGFAPKLASAEEWHGEWRSLPGELIRGGWSASLDREGDALTGRFRIRGSDVFNEGVVSGTIDGSTVALGVLLGNDAQATFAGTIEGNVVSGEWTCDALNDQGVWYGTIDEAESSHVQHPTR